MRLPDGLGSAPVGNSSIPEPSVGHFTQVVDHNDFSAADGGATFQQRYFYYGGYYKEGGPVLFYTGNEGALETFWYNTGFMFVVARQLGAFVLFMEHRDYGESPTGATPQYRFLSAEQALADYAVAVPQLIVQLGVPAETPVVAFGGSYGGMLSAWMRMKYPNIVAGAISASAPVAMFTGEVDSLAFNALVTQDYTNHSASCSTSLRSAFKQILQLAPTASGRQTLAEKLHLCSPVEDTVGTTIAAYAENALTYMAMVGYPYPTSFLVPLPGHPTQVACDRVDSAADELDALYQAMSVYYNYTGQAGTCYNVTVDATGGNLGIGGWDYQSCTEMVMPIGQNGVSDMFYDAPWNLEEVVGNCKTSMGLLARPSWVETVFGGSDVSGASNIVFSNGQLDPWSVGGIKEAPNDSITVIFGIEGAAHHLDLRTPNAADPQSVIDARATELAAIQKWVADAWAVAVNKAEL